MKSKILTALALSACISMAQYAACESNEEMTLPEAGEEILPAEEDMIIPEDLQEMPSAEETSDAIQEE